MRFFALMQPLQQYKSATQQQWMNYNAAGYNNCIRLTNKIKNAYKQNLPTGNGL